MAMDTPPPANIVFIVCNMDFSYLFEKLPCGFQKRCYVAFPVAKPSKRDKSPHWANPNSKPNIETPPKQKLIASLDGFGKYIYQMVFTGQFSQGFLMSFLPQNFEERTGKVLDVKHLGYPKLSEVIASYSHLVAVNNFGSGPVKLFPAGFVSQALPNSPIGNTSSKNTFVNIQHGGSKVPKAKAEVCSISSGGSGKGLAEHITPMENLRREHVFCLNSNDLFRAMVEPESEFMPPSISATSTKANAESPFQSDSSNTSEWEESHSSASSWSDCDQVELYEFIEPILF